MIPTHLKMLKMLNKQRVLHLNNLHRLTYVPQLIQKRTNEYDNKPTFVIV